MELLRLERRTVMRLKVVNQLGVDEKPLRICMKA